MTRPLAGQVAVVTGASRGIGAAVASALEADGAWVLRLARTIRPAESDAGRSVPCDVTDPDALHRALGPVLAEHGPPQVAVANAGGFLLKPLAETSQSEFDAQVQVNLASTFALARLVLPVMARAGSGLFVTIGSVADHVALPGNAAYAASKFGVRGLHEVLAAEYRGSGVRLTLVSPGPTDTAAWDPVDPDNRAGFTPRREMLQPADVAEAIRWLAGQPARVQVDWLRLGPA